MKKQLLSIFMVVASAISYAQSGSGISAISTIYTGDASTDAANGTPFTFNDNANFTFSEPTTGSGATAGNNGAYAHFAGPTTGYYVSGWGNGSYDANGNAQDFFATPLADTSGKVLSFRVTTNGTTSKIKVQLTDISNGGLVYGYEFDFTGNAAVKTGWTYITLPISELKEIISNNPTGSAPDVSEVNNFGKIEFVLVCTDNQGACTGEGNIDDVVVGIKTATTSPTSLNSSKLYPNPSNSTTAVEYSLAEASDVKIVVTDLLGKEIMVVTDAKQASGNHTESFDVRGLTKGTYLVNYYINNRPAKAQMLMVK